MKVHLVIDQDPNHVKVISAHRTKAGAESRIKKLKKEDLVSYQYLGREPLQLEA